MKFKDFDSLFNGFPCGIILADESLVIRYWNNEMSKLTGIDADIAITKKLSFLKFFSTTPGKGTVLDFNDCFRDRKANIAKTAFLENRGKFRFLVFIRARFIGVGESNNLLVVVTDISNEVMCSPEAGTQIMLNAREPLAKIVGRDKHIAELYKMIELAADSMANVNISGESGTGKELVANAIHMLSSRHDKPFVKVNCSALPETLLESELFGHVKGAFTGAIKDKKGKFELAGGGTLFLDEIGEISQMIQVKLLRVIQERVIERVGDNKPIRVDMRIITATNRNLREMVNKGQFREDLFYRLNVFPVHIVPLRERMNDIPLLTSHFIANFNKQTGKKIQDLSEDAYRLFMDYCWPGNVRELENCIEHAFVVCGGKIIDVFDLPQDLRVSSLRQELCRKIDPSLKPVEIFAGANNVLNQASFRIITKDQLQEVLVSNHFNRKKTAEKLGVSTVALWKKMKKFGIG